MSKREYKSIALEKQDSVGIIILNRPESLNAINVLMIEELDHAFSNIEKAEDIRVIVLRSSSERAFSVGGDIKESRERDIRQQTTFLKELNEFTKKIEAIPKPLIAAIDGFVLGGGFELMLCCDFAIATQASTFGLPEINIGVMPMAGGTQRLPRLIGKIRAKELLLLGKRISASEAYGMGLLYKVVETSKELENAWTALASDLSSKPPLALRQIKQLINNGCEIPLNIALDYAHEAGTLINISDDRKEGQKAFIEKRKPEFKGR